MKTIWKFQIEVQDRQLIVVPSDIRFLCAQMQYGKITLWARVDTESAKGEKVIYMKGTGHDCKEFVDFNIDYIGTVQELGGNLVWHVFAHRGITWV